ncbi:MAG: ATP-binding protein [Planctomycetes bacterium]|nr:ATP-binding protein [Planctomycetota bacterium]
MGSIKQAIEEFSQNNLAVYRADPQRIVRDTRAAERATGDHAGRWLFELLQNSDDAGASEVLVLVDDDTVYVADNGRGLKAQAVSAICGTDLSDKAGGTIGRKGVGFKSVYEVSRNPQVLTVDGEGIEFNPERAKAWLQQSGLDDGHVPYQWIPFFIPWEHVRRQDPQLSALTAYKTVVRLCGVPPEKKQKVEQLLRGWPPHALFAFRHLRRITAPGLAVVLSAGEDVWSLRDSRGQTPAEWRVSRHTEHSPADLLELLGADERQAISTDGVGFLIAAPLEDDCVVPTTDYLPVHVFYPTEQKGPVRLLLHAEFLVKSDRTALIPVDGNPFNAWVAERLAYHVCEFVNESYRPEAPSSHAALLVPFRDRASHPVAKDLWQRIADKAQADLRLADLEGRQRLSVGEARFISVSVRADLARTLLEVTSVRGRLLHAAFDGDKKAQEALRELGCEKIGEEELMAVIAENADSLAADTQWVWACWEWVAAWVAEKPYWDNKHKERVEQVKELPSVPVSRRLLKVLDLAGRIVTWKPDSDVGKLPDWLPLTFVEDWFRDHIQSETKESSVKKLCEELDIKKPGADVIQRAVGQAIKQYWENKQGDPKRFLHFILDQDWHETSVASLELQRCPVPLSQPVQGDAWSEARKAYFGREWGTDLLANLYQDHDSVAWVQRIGGDADKEGSILKWLGCTAVPRIVKDRGPHGKGIVAYELPDVCRAWQTAEFGYTERPPTVDAISRLEGVALEKLSDNQVCAMLVLLAKHWEEYYKGHAQATLSWLYYTTRSRTVPAFWWFEILHEIRPAMKTGSAVCALADCWLPDRRAERAIGDLLPVIDLDAFGDDKRVVGHWLISAVGLRNRIEQLTVEEWKELLCRRIPARAPPERLVSDERLRDKIRRWYEACLETVAEEESVPQKAFAPCPLLCRKADSWRYVAQESRYLDDDNDLATAFAEDVWLFHVPARLAIDAVKYLGILRLSESVQVDVTPGGPKSPLPDELLARFNESLPYVWAWRSSQSKQAAEELSARLKALKVDVVPALQANLDLDGMHHDVERRWHVMDQTIFLHRDHVNEAELAQALASAKCVDARSEADFYENLLRCNNGRQRKEKLLTKGMSDAEVERCLRDYSGRCDVNELEQEQEQEERLKGERKRAAGATLQPPLAGGSQTQQHKAPSEGQQDERSDKPSEPLDIGEEPLCVKDASTADYVLGTPPEPRAGSGSGGGGGGTGHVGCSLTDKEKAELEKAGRLLAARELEKMGFIVEKMPLDNPGFDLRAKGNGEELRVEVKAHTGRATVVDVTQRQYKEYLGQQGYRWELWNVEHLAADDADSVTITRYHNIPDDALDACMFRVDLKRCQSPANSSSAAE